MLSGERPPISSDPVWRNDRYGRPALRAARAQQKSEILDRVGLAVGVEDVVLDVGRGAGWTNVTHSDPSVISRPTADGSGEMRLSHIHRGAQGNVIVAVELVRIFVGSTDDPPDYVVFYGCAGTPRPEDVGNVYLVAETRYLALGTVN
jgi:hypothetical protein